MHTKLYSFRKLQFFTAVLGRKVGREMSSRHTTEAQSLTMARAAVFSQVRYSPGLTTTICFRSHLNSPCEFFLFKNLIPLERNKISTCRGNTRQYDKSVVFISTKGVQVMLPSTEPTRDKVRDFKT